jgi:hypothetical protein
MVDAENADNLKDRDLRWPDPHVGTGNWGHFPPSSLDEVLSATEDWQRRYAGIARPWLCWCVDEDWCLLQQRLVAACGWTPLVGTDGRCPRPKLVPGAVFLDFNERLQMPIMYMHFVIEWAYRFADTLAFWHSDVLPPVPVMKTIAAQFESIQPGEYIGVRHNAGWAMRWERFRKGYRRWTQINAHRWFEVIGCTTRDASRSQFECGCGFWRHIHRHPNATEQIKKIVPHWEHGVGLWYWERYFGGHTRELTVPIEPYHYIAKGKKRIKDEQGVRYKGRELRANYDLAKVESALELLDTLPLPSNAGVP